MVGNRQDDCGFVVNKRNVYQCTRLLLRCARAVVASYSRNGIPTRRVLCNLVHYDLNFLPSIMRCSIFHPSENAPPVRTIISKRFRSYREWDSLHQRPTPSNIHP